MENSTTPPSIPLVDTVELSSETPLVIAPLADDGPTGAVVVLNQNDTNLHALMAERLPKFIILQSNYNNKYLHFNDAISEMPDALQFNGDYSFGLETRFEVESATIGGGLIHIRSMYNNKYWSRGQSNNWITSGATKPEEDRSKWSCTLFQPVFVNSGDNRTVRFRHINTGHYVCLWRIPGRPTNECLLASNSSPDKDQCDVCTIIDWESVVVFPNRIVIKSNNGLYLRTGSDRFMGFSNGSLGSEDLEYEVTPSRNGGIRVKTIRYGNYWRDDDHSDWVFADVSSHGIHHTNTVFLPVKLEKNVIALRCLKNNLYCRRYSYSGKVNCLATVTSYIDGETRMVIEEPVLSRKIENVNYRLTDARISDEKVLVLINKEVINRSDQTNTVALDIKYTDTQTSTWNASVSITLGVTTTISAGVPTVAEGSIQVSSEFSSSYQWGKTIERSIQTGSVYTVSVPPMSRVKVSLMASQGSCDIPFSYTQHDVLTNGSIKVYEKDDGWYTGLNSFNYRYQTDQFSLDRAK
ncbi:hypothetical protein MKW98_018349 [Papaver atlanticum]|uniref:Agglutinin domain-containing protein n=1 Tax=Papaver atlanticum TaxID=357466 RepID=A0AAD4XU84_9MAGN|nr:hypothetical protein MKW98_018349 [Papaver atlanticum]